MLKLPFRLKVTDLRRTSDGIEIDCIIHDAAGTSVLRKPITVGKQQTAASITAILQHEVNILAAAMHKRGEASVGSDAEAEEIETDLNGLVGQEFTGSVVT